MKNATGNIVKIIHTFGFISGVSTMVGFLPHLIALIFILFSGMDQNLAGPLIMFTIGARALGEWFFWGKFFIYKIDSEKHLKNWRLCVKNGLFLKHPNTLVALANMLMDSIVDILLVWTALKSSIPAAWVFFALVGCQAFAAPFHGMISDYFGRRKSTFFSMLATGLTLLVLVRLNGLSATGSSIGFFGLIQFSINTQILIVLCAKSLLTGHTVVSRAVLADCIQVETQEKFGNPV